MRSSQLHYTQYPYLNNLVALAGLALAVRNCDVREQRGVPDDRGQRVAVLVG